MLSMKEYAKQKNISYEAVRKQVVRYKKELDGHVYKQDRTQFLDEYAIDFLDQKRATNPIVIFEMNKDEELQQLRDENNDLLKKVAALQEMLLQEQKKVIPLEAAVQLAEVEKAKAISEAVSEAKKKAEIEKNEAIEATKQKIEVEKDKEFEPVRKELEDKLQELQKELERPVGFIEWLKNKGKKSIK